MPTNPTEFRYDLPQGGDRFGNVNTNPQSSQYRNISGQNAKETILIRKAIAKLLFDNAPQQYKTALTLLYAKPFEEVPLDEFEYLEYGFSRSPITVDPAGATAAVPGAPGVNVSQVVTITADAIKRITLDEILTYADGVSKGVVIAINTATNQITLQSLTSESLPAVANNDIFSIQSTVRGDGMDKFQNYERLETITRYNFVQFFLRARRWGFIELQKYKNAGTTDYLAKDTQQQMEQIRIDLVSTLFNGLRGEAVLADGTVAKTAGGIYPTMLAAGSANITCSIAALRATFEAAAFATNFKVQGATRFIYGTPEILLELSKIFKDPGTRYTPSDEIAKLDLMQYEFGGMKFVPVSMQLFQEPSVFSADWARRLLVIDQQTITPTKMMGFPEIDMGETLTMGKNGTRESFQDWWVSAQLSLKFNNPISSFIINVS